MIECTHNSIFLQKCFFNQAEWFGKRGCPWHLIAHERCIYDDDSNQALINTDVHAQVLNDFSLQDSVSVVALALASLEAFKVSNPAVKEVILKSDNAGMFFIIN